MQGCGTMSQNQETLIFVSEGRKRSEKKAIERTLENLRAYKDIKFAANRTATIIAVGVFLLILSAIPILNKKQQLAQYRTQYVEAAEQLKTLHDEKQALEYEVELLKDEEYIAKLVRSEYGVSKDNELVFKFPFTKDKQLTDDN